MADTKITALTAITTVDPAADVLPIVDVSDTSMAASGTTKKITSNQILGAGGTATLASATITGNLTVQTNKLFVNVAGAAVGTTSIFADFQVQRSTNARLEIDSAAASLSYQVLDNARTGYLQHNVYASQHLWFNGVTEAMRLNATGLGVGDAPTADCKLTVRGGAFINRGAAGGASQLLVSLAASSGGNFGQISNTGTRWALGYGSTLTTVGTEALIWDAAGNVGIGVTPAGTGGCLQLKSGITFPATQVASSDANTLDDYEEGTWTPTVSATAGTLTTTTVNSATYTKIGRLVSVSVDISVVNIGTASGLLLFSLPTGLNQVVDSNVGAFRELGATGQMGQIFYQSATQVAVALYNNGTMVVNGYRFRGTYTYTTAT